MDINNKYLKGLTVKEVANILGTTRNKFYKFLRKEKIMLFTNGRNIPSDRYLRQRWFTVESVEINNSGFFGNVPKIRFTNKGFESIKKIYIEKVGYNRNNFFEEVELKLKSVLEFLGISEYDYTHRVLKKTTDNGNKVEYIMDFGTDKQSTIMKYDLRNLTIWLNKQNSLVSIF